MVGIEFGEHLGCLMTPSLKIITSARELESSTLDPKP